MSSVSRVDATLYPLVLLLVGGTSLTAVILNFLPFYENFLVKKKTARNLYLPRCLSEIAFGDSEVINLSEIINSLCYAKLQSVIVGAPFSFKGSQLCVGSEIFVVSYSLLNHFL